MIIFTALDFIVVPAAVLNSVSMSYLLSTNTSLIDNQYGMIAEAPPNSSFVYGVLVGPNGTLGDRTPKGAKVCAGAIIDEHGQRVVTACQSLLFELGIGALDYATTWGFGILNGLTMPVVLLLLGFPMRLFVTDCLAAGACQHVISTDSLFGFRFAMVLILPLLGTFVTIAGLIDDVWVYAATITTLSTEVVSFAFNFSELQKVLTAFSISIIYGALTFGIYVSCVTSAASYEKYHRSLFTVHQVRQSRLLSTSSFRELITVVDLSHVLFLYIHARPCVSSGTCCSKPLISPATVTF